MAAPGFLITVVPGINFRQICSQVAEILLFRIAHSTVGKQHERVMTDQGTCCVPEVDPGVHRSAWCEASPRRSKLDSNQWIGGLETVEESAGRFG